MGHIKSWVHRYRNGAVAEILETGPISYAPTVMPASKNRSGSGQVLPARATLGDAIRAADECAGEQSRLEEWALSL